MRRFRLIRLCGPALLALALLVPALPAQAAVTKVGTYFPLTPSRLLDTRTGVGAPKQKLGAGKSLTLKVAGRAGVPTSGVSAVVLNVTVTNATATNGYLAVYPAGTTRPSASSINFAKGRTTANSATVKLGTGGSVTIYNSAGGTSDVVVDVSGYYTSSASASGGSGYFPATGRLFDTRSAKDGPALDPGETYTFGFQFDDDVATRATKALALNITATGGKAGGYLTAWNGLGSRPAASTINYEKTTSVANLAVVPVSFQQSSIVFSIYNGSSGTVNVLADLVGAYTDDSPGAGLRFTPLNPTRIADSRTTTPPSPLLAGQTRELQAPKSVTSLQDYNVLVTNTVAIAPTATTYLTLWGTGDKPAVSSLNAPAGRTVANGTITELDAEYYFDVYNNAGTTNFAVDVTGRFDDQGNEASLMTQRFDLQRSTVRHARSH